MNWAKNVLSLTIETSAMNNKKQPLSEAGLRRKQAEKQLAEKQINGDIPVFEADVHKLLHELQVHQIELEMVNAELQEAWETSETALKNFTMLYDFAPVGFFTLDKEGIIIELNFTGADLLGEKRFSLVNSNFKLFVTEESLPVFNQFLDKTFRTIAKESCEVTLGHENKSACPVYIEGIVTGDDHKCLLSVVDISSFKK